MKMETPVFEHDCDNCRYLGHYDNHDLYVCNWSVIARYGNDGPEYVSDFIEALKYRPTLFPSTALLEEALRRVEKLGD